MSANQMTLTMIHDSAPDYECQPIKWRHLIGWHSNPGAESGIIVNII
jgi:hypothetical protein